MPSRLLTRGTLAALIASTALAGAAAPVAQGASRSCTRGGAQLEAAGGNVRVVRLELKRRHGETRREALLSCWRPTGARKRIATEQDFGLDLITSTDVTIVGGRYVGAEVDAEGGISESISAAIWDARKRKRLHTAKACSDNDADFSGPDDVVFLSGGGMAVACSRLLLFRTAASTTAVQLEPAGAAVSQIGLATNSRGYTDRLFWQRGDGTLGALAL